MTQPVAPMGNNRIGMEDFFIKSNIGDNVLHRKNLAYKLMNQVIRSIEEDMIIVVRSREKFYAKLEKRQAEER